MPDQKIEARCMGCKANRNMINGKLKTIKVKSSPRYMVCGICEKCKTKMCKFISHDESKKWK